MDQSFCLSRYSLPEFHDAPLSKIQETRTYSDHVEQTNYLLSALQIAKCTKRRFDQGFKVEEAGQFLKKRKMKSIKPKLDNRCNQSKKGLKKQRWTKEEDDLLAEKFREFGSNWSSYKNVLPNRSVHAVKNRWGRKISKRNLSLVESNNRQAADASVLPLSLPKQPEFPIVADATKNSRLIQALLDQSASIIVNYTFLIVNLRNQSISTALENADLIQDIYNQSSTLFVETARVIQILLHQSNALDNKHINKIKFEIEQTHTKSIFSSAPTPHTIAPASPL